MKVEVWSDFTSVESYLGKLHLEKAIDQFPHSEYVVIEHKTFLLQQNFKKTSEKNNVNGENHQIQNNNKSEPIDSIQLTRLHQKPVHEINTTLAHRLAHFARSKNKGRECIDQIFLAHFAEYKLIDDLTTLARIAEKIGLCPVETESVLQSNKYIRQIDIDLDEAEQMGIETLPFIVINETYAVPGSYTTNEYVEVLSSIWEEIKFKPRYKFTKNNSRTSFCEGDHCNGR